MRYDKNPFVLCKITSIAAALLSKIKQQDTKQGMDCTSCKSSAHQDTSQQCSLLKLVSFHTENILPLTWW